LPLTLGHAAPHSPVNALQVVTVGVVTTLVAMAWTVFFSARAYRTLDEFQREKEKSAWYWGGLLGLAASAPLCFFIAVGGLHWIDPNIPIGIPFMRAFLLGYFLPVTLMAGGAFISRLWPRTFKH
jgi:hypothetical protein